MPNELQLKTGTHTNSIDLNRSSILSFLNKTSLQIEVSTADRGEEKSAKGWGF